MTYRSGASRQLAGMSITVIALLVTTSAILGLSAYWSCHDADHQAFVTPLMATVQLVKGGIGDYSLSGHVCPHPTPVGLQIARIAALSAIFTGLGSVVVGAFRSQIDRLRANVANPVTVIVGVDDDTASLTSAVARTLDARSTLVVITGLGHDRAAWARGLGARVVPVDFDTPSALTALRLWRHLGRLYLMSPDPALNVAWLTTISLRLTELTDKQRVPLTIRIDDPWLAEAWRAARYGGSDTQWAADVVGKYEMTAVRLLDKIIASGKTTRVFICGTSQLTLTLCANLTRLTLERDFYTPPGSAELPALTLVGTDADEYLRDHEFYLQQAGFVTRGPVIESVPQAPTIPVMESLINAAGPAACAVILVNADGATAATRLAARFPETPIYTRDLITSIPEDTALVVGLLRSYSLALDTNEGQVQDAWERAARLIHERYVATLDPGTPRSPSAMPWAELDEFYRGSNRREVRNALWMVERIAGHTWNTWGNPLAQLSQSDVVESSPWQQLLLLGFDRESAMSMARAEHEDWCRYYLRNGWKYGSPRDDSRKIHDKLVDWSVVESTPDLLDATARNLASTLWGLRQLGYRSHPLWRNFIQVGVVNAERRNAAWTWESDCGETMHADAGDWAIMDGGKVWSVRDDIFRATYEHVGEGRWRRTGRVQARPALPGETVETLEGPTTAPEGGWIVRGYQGEQWPVPADEFARRYTEIHPTEDAALDIGVNE